MPSRLEKAFTTNPVAPKPDSVNKDNFPSFTTTLRAQYLQTLLTNTLGNTYYTDKKGLLEESKALHADIVKADPTFAAQAMVYARNHGYMRSQPIMGLAYLANQINKGYLNTITGATKAALFMAFPQVIQTPKDLADFTSVVKSIRGTEGGSTIKYLAAKWLEENLSEYYAIKYGAEKSAGTYSLADMIRIYHPKFGHNNIKNSIARYVLGLDPNSLSILTQIMAFESLKITKADSAKVAAITYGKLPHEVASTFAGQSKEVWRSIVPQMPVFALVRNLATIERVGIINEDAILEVLQSKLLNKNVITKSKIFPFTFYEAQKHVSSPQVKDMLRGAIELSFENITGPVGRTAILVDVSPSMKPQWSTDRGEFSMIASIAAVALARKSDAIVVEFGGTAKIVEISKYDSIMSQAEKIHKDMISATSPGAAIVELMKIKHKVDNIIVITDGEENVAPSFVDSLSAYRNMYNRNVKTYVIDVSPYRNAIIPTDENTKYIYGWTPEVLSFINFDSQGWNNLTEAVERSIA